MVSRLRLLVLTSSVTAIASESNKKFTEPSGSHRLISTGADSCQRWRILQLMAEKIMSTPMVQIQDVSKALSRGL
jgi:hypothetical protein